MYTIQEPLEPGAVLVDRYVISEVHRLSGMSALYEVQDVDAKPPLGRYALKESIVQDNGDHPLDEALKSFESLAQVLEKVDHPGIASTYGHFIDENRTYLVTDFIIGDDLETLSNAHRGPLPIDKVYQWGLTLAESLHYLHTFEHGQIVYRDMKPANIMLTRDDALIKLVDFGIAILFEAGRVYPPLGTDGYAAPEQYMGDSYPLVDIYGLGATMHQLLTGSDPRLETPFSFVERPISKLNPKVPAPLAEIVMRAVAYNSWDRFGSMKSLLDALKDIGDEIKSSDES